MFLRLIKERLSGVNTYLQVDKDNNPIIEKRDWSARPTTQNRIVRGFDNLILQRDENRR